MHAVLGVLSELQLDKGSAAVACDDLWHWWMDCLNGAFPVFARPQSMSLSFC